MMAQDIRELFKNDKSLPNESLSVGHHIRFEARLNRLHETEGGVKNKTRFPWMKVAAVLLVAVSIGVLGYNQLGTSSSEPAVTNVVNLNKVTPEDNPNSNVVPVYLSEVSPQFKKVEDYYMASINMELAKLQVNDENEELINTFMTQLAELDTEYVQLNRELKEAGVNEQTVNTLIANLQLRLELLFKLKTKLNQLKEDTHENLQNETA